MGTRRNSSAGGPPNEWIMKRRTRRRAGWTSLLLALALVLPLARPGIPAARAAAVGFTTNSGAQARIGKFNGHTVMFVVGAVVAILLIMKR